MSEKLVFRSTSGGDYYGAPYGEYMEKRQLFLRSYQFSRKQSFAEKVSRSVTRVKRVVLTRLRSAPKLKRVVWSRLRSAFYYRRRRFFRLLHLHEPCYCF
ncbi:hypothetical protein AtNW77_Chr5g0111221 [Arabidopsis thaliana]|uniref:AT5g26741 n=4 Tax=Arabidopsis TaxID=3701 RepID=Q94EW8_ARATH|nr:uncharacterized protein AT5G26731 [Arabidopsis thaliana]KAG7603551.1 hypothetical protein ISN45_At05g025050 [Arabidopsis thaliana x Arabidopsis arenosa]KAG7610474.1 hypothetical protein ISN44_As05g024810 [Arabidopsis suecica]AAK63865.1 AT5g26741 [Arabidopsis thaliana]AAM98314.1 At5g26741/At5g26741 [Arabidopsis thaliana]AED93570.1 hypothetical protein AT5G26731 [Arabidopsis thaliana]|eukprot:NP_568485.1 hypothetical protein AT5G26731 [Arabidopsis thaliana]